MNMGIQPMALPSPPPGGAIAQMTGRPGTLTRRAKAAVVVRYLLNEGAEVALEDLPDDLQLVLTQQMGALRLVDRDTVTQVIEEFTEELERVGLSFSGGIAGALKTLDGKISPHMANRLRKEHGVRAGGNPWSRILGQPAEKLKPIFEQESPEICAVIISKLDVRTAADVLGLLPGPLARRITYAVSQTSAVTPAAVDRIGVSIAAQLEAEPVTAFETGPVQRVGAILNSSRTATRDDVLTGLDETDQAFAAEVRKAIFTFNNIPARVAPRDVPVLLRNLDQAQLIAALAAAGQAGDEDVSEFIFSNMSARLADQMKEEIAELGEVKPADGETAMSEIAARIRDMEAKGEIFLLQPDDEADAA